MKVKITVMKVKITVMKVKITETRIKKIIEIRKEQYL